MATERSIRFDFNQAKAQADEIERLANKLNSLADQEFAGTMQSISSHWQGQNSRAYLNKASMLQSKMNNSSKELKSIASSIRTAAKKMYDAEMRALRLAQQRNNGGKGAFGGGGGGSR